MFSISLIFSDVVSDQVFEVLAYWVPDTVPVVVEICFIWRELWKATRVAEFQNSLYDQLSDGEGAKARSPPNRYHYQTRSGTHIQEVSKPFHEEDERDEFW